MQCKRERDREKKEEATIKYHEIFQLNYEKFLLPMHDIYEIIMFSSTNPTASRIQSNRDNMNFSSLCFLESAFYVTRLYAFWIFHSFSCGKRSLSELRKASFSQVFLCKNEKAFGCKFHEKFKLCREFQILRKLLLHTFIPNDPLSYFYNSERISFPKYIGILRRKRSCTLLQNRKASKLKI